ncbi:MAG TPA: FAD-dependent oxidoreductase [Spirochaetota bacterium]|nr:FAD-dependent oxidoreductase [Spirochaetota bacterium]HOD16441.1 FAD-dependent oxidoreductase [Spirochaetota bacterium]HPN12682.1 FAD-dependent oxidoreductase [Spirochaetota bacterium]
MARYLIIGGVAGGATAAARLRRLDESAEIIMFERGEYVSYANCGLPYYIGGVIPVRDRLFVQTADGFRNRFNIDVRVSTEVVSIARERKQVEVRDLANGAITVESYDKLVLSPGAEPLKPPIPGIDIPGIFTLRNVMDTDRIKQHCDTTKPKSAVIVGGGFIGLEMAENLHAAGMEITLVEMAEQVMVNLDYEMAAEVHHHLRAKGVTLLLKDGVASFRDKGRSIEVVLSSGRTIAADIVILSIGVRPDTKLAREAGLDIGKRGGILVDRHLRSSDPDIYAIGDAIEFANPVTGRSVITLLAGPANKQGRLVADNIVTGNTRIYGGSIGTAVAKVFDLTVASTGASEKTLAAEGIPCVASITHSASHATYYPGASQMSVKILFSPDSCTLLGAQIVGASGVDRRIDVFAALIGKKGSVYDLMEFDHAYAPPYSSAKDPVNIAGFVAENILTGVMKVMHWRQVPGLDRANTFILDVRTPGEHRAGTIEGSVNIPVDELRDRIASVPRDKTIVVFCAVGQRAHVAARILRQSGFEEVYNLSGGYRTYGTVLRDSPGPACC